MRSWLSLIPGIILSLRASAAMFSNGDQNPPYGGYKCMDVAGAKPGDGTPAQVWDCHGGPNQQFTFEDEQIYAMGGTKCLDVSGGSRTPGTKVQIYTCNGSGAQIWYYGQRGNIVYFNNSSLCLDAQDQSNGRQLIVLPCIFDNDGWPTLSQTWQIK